MISVKEKKKPLLLQRGALSLLFIEDMVKFL